MARPQNVPTTPREPKDNESGERSYRDSLPQNPASPFTAKYPDASNVQPMAAGRPPITDAPYFSLSTNWLGGQLSDSGLIPPDTMGDVSPTQVLVCINGRIRVFDRNGNVGALNTTTDAFFNSVRSSGTSDPRVRYDRLSGRWILEMIDVTSQNNRIMLAVSNGSTINATTDFTFFFFNYASPLPAPSAPSSSTSFCDYASLGIDANAIYIAGNIFSGGFTSCDAFVVRKSALLSGSLVVTAFRNIGTNAAPGPYAPHGVDNDDPAATEGYFVGVDTLTFGKIMIRRISTPGATPTISPNITLTVPATQFAALSPQVGSARTLDVLDDRLFAVKMFRNRITGVQTVWAAHNIGVDASGVALNGGRSGARWYQITNMTTTPALVQSGTMFDPAATNPNFFSIPSIAMNGQGHAAIGVTRSGLASHPDAYYSFRLASDGLGSLQAPIGITASTTVYDVGASRWGDYTHTILDPADGQTLWTFQEYCNATNSYGVRVAKLLAPAPGSISLSTTGAYPGDTVNVTVTGTGIFDGGATFPQRLTAAISGAGVTINSITFVPNTPPTDPQAIVNLTVQPGAAFGGRTLTIKNPDGQSSPGATFTVLTPAVSGHVNLSSWVGTGEPAQQLVIEIRNGGGTVLQTVNTTLDGSGNFTFTPTVVGGTYTFTAKGTTRFLRKALTGQVMANSGISGLTFTLVNGDVTGDNAVSSQDLTAVRIAFGSSPGAGNWNPDADLNGDGFVSSADLTIVRQNFGQSGD